MGVDDNTYYKREIAPFPEAERRAGQFSIMTSNEKDFVALRVANKLTSVSRERPVQGGGTGSYRRPLLGARRRQPLRDGAFRVLGIGRDEAWHAIDKQS